MPQPRDDRKAGRISRRKMLTLGATGIGAASLAVLGASTVEAGREGGQTPGSGQGQQPPRPPAPDAIVNLATIPTEDWTEPWVWRPADWPGQPLVLNVVGNPNPPRAVSPGNRFTPLYSFNGTSPGPTIRVRGNERLRVTVRNHLGPNLGRVPVGPCPDPFEQRPDVFAAAICRMQQEVGIDCKTPPTTPLIFEHIHELLDAMPAPVRDTSCLPGPINMPHASHTTNLHTHGLHVNPGINANGTFGDNTFSRVLPRADGEMRRSSKDANCRRPLEPTERVGEGRYEYALSVPRKGGAAGAPVPHPPGTHWYHPHSHGATHDQVASGLAGFLIVEGDVDDAINRAMTGTDRPDPSQKTGPYDYRERLILLQRVEVFSVDLDRSRRQAARIAPPTSVNGAFTPTVMFMRPGAVERWRVLNGSVDGRGFKQFMVLEGQFVFNDRQLWRVVPAPSASRGRIGSGGAAQARARHARGHRESDATVVPTLVRRHHAGRDRERARAPHDSRSLEAERRQPESARPSGTRGRAAAARDAEERGGLLSQRG